MQGFPVYQQNQQNKGTLVPGQTISVNKYTVQVEKYLSQGNFVCAAIVSVANYHQVDLLMSTLCGRPRQFMVQPIMS